VLPVSFGGKCMDDSLKLTSQALDLLDPEADLFLMLSRFNVDVEESVAWSLRFMAAKFAKARRSKRRDVAVFGFNCNINDELSVHPNCIGNMVLQESTVFRPHPLNPKSVLEPLGPISDLVQSPCIAFVMPYSKRVAHTREIIKANLVARMHYLVILDPLKQFKASELKGLNSFASTLVSTLDGNASFTIDYSPELEY
jgi:hypothetical protein